MPAARHVPELSCLSIQFNFITFRAANIRPYEFLPLIYIKNPKFKRPPIQSAAF